MNSKDQNISKILKFNKLNQKVIFQKSYNFSENETKFIPKQSYIRNKINSFFGSTNNSYKCKKEEEQLKDKLKLIEEKIDETKSNWIKKELARKELNSYKNSQKKSPLISFPKISILIKDRINSDIDMYQNFNILESLISNDPYIQNDEYEIDKEKRIKKIDNLKKLRYKVETLGNQYS